MNKTKITSQEALLDYYKMMIATDVKWTLRSLEVVYNNQTSFEKAAEATTDSNNVGFSQCDAKKLSYYARLYIASKKPNSKVKLYPETIEYLKKKMPKYANQLVHQSIESGRVRKVDGGYIW